MPKYTDAQKQQWVDQRQQQLETITQQLEQGVAEVFTSEKYADYLKTVSKFTRYSTNNTILISMQRPDATYVAGYEAWKQKFHRQVKRGEKGIKIFAPVPYKTTIERDKLDPYTGQPLTDNNGNKMTEEVEIKRAAFRIVTVFDYSQTTGDPIPTLEPKLLDADVADYEQFLQALIQTAHIPVSFEDIQGSAKGYYNRTNDNIVICKDMPEAQTVKTLIHEISHSRLDAIKENEAEEANRPDQNTREVRAESIAFVVSNHYGLDTSDYSFTYIAGWSDGRDIPELKAELQTIRDTASTLIDEIDQNLYELEQAREAETALEVDELEQEYTMDSNRDSQTTAYALENGNFLTVQQTADGWDCTLYNSTLVDTHAQCFTEPQSMEDARNTALKAFEQENVAVTPTDSNALQEKLFMMQQYTLSATVLPYIEADGGAFTLDTAVEPVVSIIESNHPALREGMQLPLHLANKLTSDLEVAQLKEALYL